MFRKPLFFILSSFFIISLLISPNTLAHVVVKPATAGLAAYQTFVVSVPNERETSTTGLRLIVPDEIQSVTPNVKPGWQISIKKNDAGKVTEITWSDGQIPAGQRDEFAFSTKTPASETTLNWKAYQTYQDGIIVSWDTDPATATDDDSSTDDSKPKPGPYSSTKIVKDATPVATTSNATSNDDKNDIQNALNWGYTATGVAILGLLLGAFAFLRSGKSK